MVQRKEGEGRKQPNNSINEKQSKATIDIEGHHPGAAFS
jgi:hypothetical protein